MYECGDEQSAEVCEIGDWVFLCVLSLFVCGTKEKREKRRKHIDVRALADFGGSAKSWVYRQLETRDFGVVRKGAS